MVTVDYDGGNNEEVGGSGVGHVMTAVHNGKCQARPPMDHFERVLEEAYSNHTYPNKHKLKACDMMNNLMISRSHTRGMELSEDPGRRDMMPFPLEDTTMMVYNRHPHQEGVMCLT
jgi:hypothetical protein